MLISILHATTRLKNTARDWSSSWSQSSSKSLTLGKLPLSKCGCECKGVQPIMHRWCVFAWFCLGVLISDDLTWHAYATCIVNKAYIRMTILRKLFEFKLSVKDLLQIYKLYIRSIVEQNFEVWGSSITHEE